jgi:hypothetical protein
MSSKKSVRASIGFVFHAYDAALSDFKHAKRVLGAKEFNAIRRRYINRRNRK